MTGGIAVILGETGVNFGAGMSGGIAYVYDEDGLFDSRCNLEMIDLENVSDPDDEKALRKLIKRHLNHTGSSRAKRLLENWEHTLAHFIKVCPVA